jgi:hypothetical protein
VANEFNIRKVTVVKPHLVNIKIKEIEGRWLEALLLRYQIPRIMLNKKYAGELGNSQWREYLWEHFRLNIYKHLENDRLRIYQWLDEKEENVLVAEWTKPEVVRIRPPRGRESCELRLRYWNLI